MEPEIARFIQARLAEECSDADAATQGRWMVTRDPLGTHVENGDGAGRVVMKSGRDRLDGCGDANATHIARHDPASVLARVESDRRELAELDALPHYAWAGPPAQLCAALANDDRYEPDPCTCGRDAFVDRMRRIKAARFSSHPEYRAEWAPA